MMVSLKQNIKVFFEKYNMKKKLVLGEVVYKT